MINLIPTTFLCFYFKNLDLSTIQLAHLDFSKITLFVIVTFCCCYFSGSKKVTITNKVILEKSRCANCMVDKSRFLK